MRGGHQESQRLDGAVRRMGWFSVACCILRSTGQLEIYVWSFRGGVKAGDIDTWGSSGCE